MLPLFAYDGGPMFPAVMAIVILSFAVHLWDRVARDNNWK